jgi:hypothetical protein
VTEHSIQWRVKQGWGDHEPVSGRGENLSSHAFCSVCSHRRTALAEQDLEGGDNW